ncbi:hypothetical protein SAMN05216207_11443 [Pseudonocardia ammonioxydans]|uniref:Uncharacterized protein n=2 Tax=Pseudonocardia ammonioxydans TaxID=260086 RepID=A0A1I5IXA4_PSUAM|nr:hypothetical protein SAMN05216207_11443 [Pseudonocardia ammonioxydans]
MTMTGDMFIPQTYPLWGANSATAAVFRIVGWQQIDNQRHPMLPVGFHSSREGIPTLVTVPLAYFDSHAAAIKHLDRG